MNQMTNLRLELANADENQASMADGYASQINMLKVDMAKKAQAVDELQCCVDSLRDHKVRLETEAATLKEQLDAMQRELELKVRYFGTWRNCLKRHQLFLLNSMYTMYFYMLKIH